ncbi:acyl-CoA dehydrogenase [Marinibacterium profundimaris]|uniref:Acyl-CoA dehydrogenase n=1 Tax=Marinibacterium profundimaris TaxID=1679460 RepID=A0A225NMH2_9RHOB|nr:acyl-CoA dehydrogenase [Marinibacterium profundimaris]OWU75724.1 acyl-CoA dehydrogenase [Marinibacterium profundimaris]
MRAYDREDLLFQLFDVAGVEEIIAGTELDADAVRGILDTADQIATDHYLPHAHEIDENEPVFDNGRAILPDAVKPAVDAFIEGGFLAGPFRPEHGGLGLPETVHQAASFVFSASNVSIKGYAMLTIGAGRLIQSFGTEDQKTRYLEPMVEGRYFGTMCLSEPQAGSSLSDITTKAEPMEDGRYRISGRKMWISAGEHELSENIVHMVLAKIPGGPPGVKGISLFIVPKIRLDGTRNDVTLAGLNHKMGYRGTTNCALNFGEQGDCIGELVGEPHQGLRYMFQMMNEARIGVGMGATALGQAGFQASLAYARDRPQGRSPVAKDPASPQVPLIGHADIRRLLLAQKAAVEPALALALYCAVLVDRHRAGDADALTLLDVLTPVAKSWPSEFCLEANKHAIQVLGGAGYTRDYPVERHYRDNRLNPIHEGTHGIQGMDLLGRKVMMQNGAGFTALTGAIRADITGAGHPLGDPLSAAVDRLEEVTRSLTAQVLADPERGLANATLYLDLTGHVIMGWMWLRIARAAAEKAGREGDSDFLKGKQQAARYFYARELSRTEGWARTLLANDASAFEMQAGWF